MSVSEVATDLAEVHEWILSRSMPDQPHRLRQCNHGREQGLWRHEHAPSVVAELTAALRRLEGHARRKLAGSSAARGECSERGWPITQIDELVPSRVSLNGLRLHSSGTVGPLELASLPESWLSSSCGVRRVSPLRSGLRAASRIRHSRHKLHFVCFGIVAGHFSTDLASQTAAVDDNACRRTGARPSRRSSRAPQQSAPCPRRCASADVRLW
ncbi:hypothetical protein ACVIIV_003369 [Bradyrhizobium sp. USDA 4354]